MRERVNITGIISFDTPYLGVNYRALIESAFGIAANYYQKIACLLGDILETNNALFTVIIIITIMIIAFSYESGARTNYNTNHLIFVRLLRLS